jgi:CYTH domain-containing protein
MPLEIERKFLAVGDGWRGLVQTSTLLRQGYLANTARASIRVRAAGQEAWISVKAMTPGMARAEYEYPVPAADAADMLEALCERPFVEKWRHRVPWTGGLVWEIDEFLGDNSGLVVAEIELDRVEQEFERPAWLGREVTDDLRFYNFRLATTPWSQFRKAFEEGR